MATLSRSDAERLLRFVADAESIGGDQPFTPELLVELGRLIEADFVTYHEVDHVHRRPLMFVLRPGDDDEEEEEEDYAITDEDWERMNEHPVCRRWREEGSFGALRLFDVVTRREFRRSRFYTERFVPWGVEFELKSRLPSPLWHAKTFALHRSGVRDFTERDRLVLDFLTPHFSRLWDAARTRRRLGQALAELDREDGSRGLVFFGADGEVEFMSPPVQRLLRDFFPAASGGRLPAALMHWLEGENSASLVRRRGDRRLVVERTVDSLIFEERIAEVQLTGREREVLSWVARGKTNVEIAELLWLAPSTVRKHLENVYAKLGVNTRTAAVARFFGLSDAQAS